MHDQIVFRGFGVITTSRAKSFKKIKIELGVWKRTECTLIVSVQGLVDIRKFRFQMFDQWKNANTIGDHSKWDSLRCALPTARKTARPISISQDEQWPVKTAIKNEVSSGQSYMTNYSNNPNAIDLIESIFCIHEYKSSILCGRFRVPNILNPVAGTNNSCL